ncbi:MAG: 23S rRNA (uracil(1939)-C(5))-methyltransferase RlmD [Clostridia bacterium]|nr:23S rRNA (uracil(1939)-C(5))-methyltransferase RlmD [Clostridia bacterium]
MMLKKNMEIELDIEAFTSEGSGVAHYDGMAVFVNGSAAGDRVKAHIIKVKKSYAIAKCVKIIKPSADRITSDCPVFESCGGCAFRHISYEAEAKMKREKVENAFKRIGGIEKKLDGFVGADSLCRYRNKAEYPLSFDRRLNIGFYALHTHRIVNCEDCVLSPQVFSDIVAIIRKWVIEYGVSVYDSESGKGLLRHIFLRQAQKSGDVMLCLVINGDRLPKQDKLLERLLTVPQIKSVVLNKNRAKTNVILSDECETVRGDDFIYDELCGITVRLSALSFYQVNHDMAEKLYTLAREYAQPSKDKTLLDMYCGAGTIGLSMARDFGKVIGVEIVAPAVENAKENARLNGIDNASFYNLDAAEAARLIKENGERADVIVLDPPRKGCSAELVNTVCEMSPERVVYVSCDPATLARDCKLFSEKGYNLEKLTAVDLFPRTVHVESVCLLTKN